MKIAIFALIVLVLGSLPAHSADKQRGLPDAPTNAAAIAGSFALQGGLGHYETLRLSTNGTFKAECHGCVGSLGEATGGWTLLDKRVVLTETNATGVMKGRLTSLDTLKFKSEWILIRVEDEGFYQDTGSFAFRPRE